MHENVRFESDGLSLAGEYSRPHKTNEAAAAAVVAHGFAGATSPALVDELLRSGLVVLTFNFRGYGESEGESGRVVVDEQVADLLSAVDWLSDREGVDESRVIVVGSSLGGSIAIKAAASDSRIRACVAGCPIARGETVLRLQYDTEEKWQQFLEKIDRHSHSGEKFHRFEIVSIPEDIRDNLPPGTPMWFSPETARSFIGLEPIGDVKRIPPRPLLLLHAVDDRVVPASESEELRQQVPDHCDLHRLDAGDHFIFGRPEVCTAIADWLAKHGYGRGRRRSHQTLGEDSAAHKQL